MISKSMQTGSRGSRGFTSLWARHGPRFDTLGAPLFSRNHNNYCAVGTCWLLKRGLFDGDWLIFFFFF